MSPGSQAPAPRPAPASQGLDEVRVLLVADTHLGFDLPFRPRIERRRRGPDFFENLDRALAPALRGEVDLVVHGGDLFFRSRVPDALVEMALAPLARVAQAGVPVYLVPGNHERSRIPLHLWAAHPQLHIFERPRTFLCPVRGRQVALAGFPFARDARDRFGELLHRTGLHAVTADVALLCVHQIVEGARVGVRGYTFRRGPDIVRGGDIPAGISAVLAGHIHRAQVLTHDLAGRPLAAPVIYPGSVERTSFDEREEEKGYMRVRLTPAGAPGGRLLEAAFVPLPTRPMVSLVVDLGALGAESLADHLRRRLPGLDPDSVVRVQVRGSGAEQARAALGAEQVRELAPPSMDVSVAYEWLRPRRGGRPGPKDRPAGW